VKEGNQSLRHLKKRVRETDRYNWEGPPASGRRSPAHRKLKPKEKMEEPKLGGVKLPKRLSGSAPHVRIKELKRVLNRTATAVWETSSLEYWGEAITRNR